MARQKIKQVSEREEKTLRYTLDDWQQQVLDTKGNLCLRSGRQVGKSFIIAMKAAQYALENPNKLIMVIAFTEKQANLLFSKILNNIVRISKEAIAKPKPTKHVIHLKNKSEIYCYAAGTDGYGIMGYTIDLLIADEAAFIPELVWNSVTPALAITRGSIWLLSTPYLSEGYYYDSFHNENFKSFHQSAEDCPRRDDEFLKEKKRTLTRAQYAQMYLGEFVDDFHRIFTEEWIKSVCIVPMSSKEGSLLLLPHGDKYFGYDIAGMGDDQSTYEGITLNEEKIKQFFHETTEKTRITEVIQRIKDIDIEHKPVKHGIDGGGIGVGVVDTLLDDYTIRDRIIDLNASRRIVDAEGDRKGKLLKEAMYMYFLALGEKGNLKLFNDDDIKASLRSIQGEKKEGGRLEISGRWAHITEGLIRAVYPTKTKSLKLWVASKSHDIME